MDRNPNRIAPGASTDERAPSSHPSGAAPDFEPVPVQPRHDGWTPARQREYVEALADLGVAKWAAERVGMSVQGANRLRRRADARGFDLACEAAERFGRRRVLSLAFERAIEGSVKRHYYRGELVGEERVYDNRLLVAALPRLMAMEEPRPESLAVERNWQPWLDAIERGEDPAAAAPEPAAAGEPEPAAPTEADPFTGDECWEEHGIWWTEFPPPEGFCGEEEGYWGDDDYRRTLTPEEEAVLRADEEEERAEDLAAARAARDLFFGFVPAGEKIETKGSSGPLPSRTGCELSEPSPPPESLFTRSREAAKRHQNRTQEHPARPRPDRPRKPLRAFAPSREPCAAASALRRSGERPSARALPAPPRVP